MSSINDSTPLIGAHGLFRGSSRPVLLWRTGAILAAVGIMSGAFGTHTLRGRPGLTVDKVRAWETAAHYALFNGIALLAVSLHPRFAAHKFAGPAIAVGSAVFSSSIMALVLGGGWLKWLGPITPIGGMVMVAGYVALAL